MKRICRVNKKYIILGLCIVLLGLATAYSAFSSNLNVIGTSSIASKWDIEITDVSVASTAGVAENSNTPSWDNLTASMEANLYQQGDSVSYTVTIANKGNLDAALASVSKSINSSNDAIKISTTGYTEGEILKQNETKVITVTIEYNPDFAGEAVEGSSEVAVTFNYVQN